jgi:hypothetical protein
MKNVKQDKGMPPSSGAEENAKTNANVPAPQEIFQYSDGRCEERDLIDRLKNGHDKGDYSQYVGSL